ncbi:hypothetical protein [Syntrophomonas palmitatica]|uniref:hypothetical protein n=1 Tax=Syntrophomonas palmitatica TaxID=402877 RepID=UPI0006D0D799|nr:hypothetical protein [Syntrophomonas palmitatica]
MSRGNRVLNGVTLIVVIAFFISALFWRFNWGGYLFPVMVLAGICFLSGYLLADWKKLSRSEKWAIMLSIIAWAAVACSVVPNWGLFARLF